MTIKEQLRFYVPYVISVALGVMTMVIPLQFASDVWPEGNAFVTWVVLITFFSMLAPNAYVYLIAVVGSVIYGMSGMPDVGATVFPPFAVAIAGFLTLIGRTPRWKVKH